MCDLPFGKQYGSLHDNAELYPSAVKALARVMSPAPHAKMVFLTDAHNLALLRSAIAALGQDTGQQQPKLSLSSRDLHWRISAERAFDLSPHTRAFMVLCVRGPADVAGSKEETRLPWEKKNAKDNPRSDWAAERVRAQPQLVPFCNRHGV